MRSRRPALPLLILLVAAALASGCSALSSEADAPARPPVVLLILDEFPTDALLGPDGEIDALRYPNFAALARQATWFPNAYTVYDSTFKAVPNILDANLPRRGTAPDRRGHARSVYHLLDRLGYGVVNAEAASALCPPEICAAAPTRRPGVLPALGGDYRPDRLHAWVHAIRRRSRPTLYLQHALLPHEPWIYLPSGRQSRPPGDDPIVGINKPPGFDDPSLTEHNHQRHLLQVGYVDHELGRLLARLRRTGLFDRALLAVVADHGYSFEVGVDSRRLVTESNVEEVAPVPMFVKAPGQRDGEANESLVRNIDVVPTIADLLDAEIDWPHDGRSAFADETSDRGELRIRTRDFSELVSLPLDELERRRASVRRRRAATFGTGAESRLLFGSPWASAYRIGPHPELLDLPLRALGARRSAALRAQLANARLLASVSRGERILPTRVTGVIEGGGRGKLRDVAVAVNGRVRATGHSFRLHDGGREFFSLMVPEDSLREGSNRVELLEIDAAGRVESLYSTS